MLARESDGDGRDGQFELSEEGIPTVCVKLLAGLPGTKSSLIHSAGGSYRLVLGQEG